MGLVELQRYAVLTPHVPILLPLSREIGKPSYSLDIFVLFPLGTRVFAGSSGLSGRRHRSEEHTSELQSLMRISSAVFCLKKKTKKKTKINANDRHIIKSHI